MRGGGHAEAPEGDAAPAGFRSAADHCLLHRHPRLAAGEPWPDEDEPAFVILCRDGIDLQFYLAEAGEAPIGPATIYLDTDDAKAFHDAVRDRVDVEWGPEVYEYGRREFSFRDPDGYAVIISEATDDPVTDSE